MMRSFSVALLVCGLMSSWAVAQTAPPKVFVASTGADSNDGGRATPKRSFQAAHDAVAAGGEIVVLDTAGYGPVTITKSVAIVVPPGVSGFVTVPSGDGITINAGIADVVTLRGLVVEGAGTGNGIHATQAAALVIEDTTVRNFSEGIFVFSSADIRLVVKGGAIRNSTNGMDLETAVTGIRVDALVVDTEVTVNEKAFFAYTYAAGGAVDLLATRCAINGGTYGFYAQYSGASIVADNCSIVGSRATTGVFTGISGGIAYSRNNNTITGTANFGTPTSLTAH